MYTYTPTHAHTHTQKEKQIATETDLKTHDRISFTLHHKNRQAGLHFITELKYTGIYIIIQLYSFPHFVKLLLADWQHYKLQVVIFNDLALPVFVFITSKKNKLIKSQRKWSGCKIFARRSHVT
jgi:hypothetical protein